MRNFDQFPERSHWAKLTTINLFVIQRKTILWMVKFVFNCNLHAQCELIMCAQLFRIHICIRVKSPIALNLRTFGNTSFEDRSIYIILPVINCVQWFGASFLANDIVNECQLFKLCTTIITWFCFRNCNCWNVHRFKINSKVISESERERERETGRDNQNGICVSPCEEGETLAMINMVTNINIHQSRKSRERARNSLLELPFFLMHPSWLN